MRTVYLLITFLASLTANGQNFDGRYVAFLEKCQVDSTGIKTCFGDKDNVKWFDRFDIEIIGDTVFADTSPIMIDSNHDTLSSASTGGFYYYRGLIKKDPTAKVLLSLAFCHYCPEDLIEIDDRGNELKKVKEAKELILTLEVNNGQYFLNGQLMKPLESDIPLISKTGNN